MVASFWLVTSCITFSTRNILQNNNENGKRGEKESQALYFHSYRVGRLSFFLLFGCLLVHTTLLLLFWRFVAVEKNYKQKLYTRLSMNEIH